MATYEASVLTTITTATANIPFAAFRSSTTQRSEIKEIGIFQRTGGTSPNSIGITRSTAVGTGTLTGVTGTPRDPGAVATTGQLITAWGTAAPTVSVAAGANILRHYTSGTTVGSGVIWTFDLQRMLYLASNVATSELVFINLNATTLATYDIYVAWEE